MKVAKFTGELLNRHQDLTGSELRVYLMILFHTGRNGVCRNSLQYLCRAYGLDFRAGASRLNSLRRKGWIDSEVLKPLVGIQSIFNQ
jgi:hypothetical protein